jgi:hypothetical protein
MVYNNKVRKHMKLVFISLGMSMVELGALSSWVTRNSFWLLLPSSTCTVKHLEEITCQVSFSSGLQSVVAVHVLAHTIDTSSCAAQRSTAAAVGRRDLAPYLKTSYHAWRLIRWAERVNNQCTSIMYRNWTTRLVFWRPEKVIFHVGAPFLNWETGVYSYQRLCFPSFPWIFPTRSMYLVQLEPNKFSATHLTETEQSALL